MQEITVQELKQWQDEGRTFQLVDVREEHEYETCNLNGLLIPMGDIMMRHEEIKKDIPVVIHCRSGARSATIVQLLEKQLGYTNVSNLKGGILAWIKEIDPTLTSY
ncbi:MAG: rhodanese-like domain-containing protein [Bacteroidetes bacterium]|jgi:rhodanese-related sulfurtransferase|nr:rhodanese-like domain-containing protein [Bacteroidota bacterium]